MPRPKQTDPIMFMQIDMTEYLKTNDKRFIHKTMTMYGNAYDYASEMARNIGSGNFSVLSKRCYDKIRAKYKELPSTLAQLAIAQAGADTHEANREIVEQNHKARMSASMRYTYTTRRKIKHSSLKTAKDYQKTRYAGVESLAWTKKCIHDGKSYNIGALSLSYVRKYHEFTFAAINGRIHVPLINYERYEPNFVVKRGTVMETEDKRIILEIQYTMPEKTEHDSVPA